MKMNVYCYFDSVAGFYGQPFFVPFDEDSMKEQYRRACVSKDGEKLKDTCLYHLGVFDDQEGIFETFKPVFLSRYEGNAYVGKE